MRSSSDESSSSSESDHDVEQAKLLPQVDEKAIDGDGDDTEEQAAPPPKRRSFQFLIWTAINTLATIAIVG